MQNQDIAQPVVDRILANPLQFQAASKPDFEEGSSGSSYIVIGDQRRTAAMRSSQDGEAMVDGQGQGHGHGQGQLQGQVPSGGLPRKSLPRSFSEALEMYTAKKKPVAHEKDVELSDQGYASSTSNEELSSGKGVEQDTESSDNSSGNDEFHEAQEYAESIENDEKSAETSREGSEEGSEDLGEDIGEDIGEDVGEELGLEVSENSHSIGNSDQTEDQDQDQDDDNEDQNQDQDDDDDDDDDNEDQDLDFKDNGNVSSDSDASDDEIADSEKLGLMREAQEYAQMDASTVPEPEIDGSTEDLKHKLPHSKRPSPTPPTFLSDIDQFYQFNEEFRDRGSNKSIRILKNWGPQLSKMRPKGLLNHGVTCYTNAAVQAMIHVPAIQHYLFDILRGQYKSTIQPQSVSHVLAETTKKMWSSESSNTQYINPKKLIGRLDDINCMMSEWQQEDSHEYFMSLMSRLQEDGVPRGHKLTESIMYDIFGGLLRQEVTCKSCGQVSKTEQPIYDLSLHLKGKKQPEPAETANTSQASTEEQPQRRFSIEKSIRDFFNSELIKADKATKEGYFCEKCHKTTNATKHNSILRAPETLLVHLKKFRFNGTSSSKMKQAVSYPMFLDLTEYCEDAQNSVPLKYQLISVVVHEGRSLSSGHYIAHCKQPDGSWVTYDDEYINKISERQVLKEPGAYYLVYTRLTHKSVPLASNTGAASPNQAPASETRPSSTGSGAFKKKKKNKGKNKAKKRRLGN
ncbi:LAFA_0F14730g1_1 [Lachancea sp. 'fantastica']|nr:LAFA_0F14730g1_1 [Lachancea sp. 'fantastica']